MPTDIAILGLSCEFPGARTPEDLWDTALHQRRWFRNLPPQRLPAEYIDPTGTQPDATQLRHAAVLEGYDLPVGRLGLRQNEVRAADFTHWLALDCATRALDDAGLGDRLPREATSVIVGNTLTGESSRANMLRLRHPFFRKVLEETGITLSKEQWRLLEQNFKGRLAPMEGLTLAGALSNVIAGRIAHYHDLKGGCHCVDAACASSLLAVEQACNRLAAGEIECALVGGVDVSLDPMELVGFTRAGALCDGEMKVFDVNRSGFIPGEGCGFAVLMRADHPAVKHTRIRALLRGWGMSSDGRHQSYDGHHHLTSPSPEGQRLALERAYRRAGFSIDTVQLFEAHGTGTKVGDQVEVQTLLGCLNGTRLAAAVGSIKANIGHTKAAAGMAGLIKAVCALEARILPPVTGCEEPMDELRQGKVLRVLTEAEPWPKHAAVRAGISGFGFGGVNVHVVLEGAHPTSTRIQIPVKHTLPPDTHLFGFDGDDRSSLLRSIAGMESMACHLAEAQIAPAARACAQALDSRFWRAAVIASDADGLAEGLRRLIARLEQHGDAFAAPPLFAGTAAGVCAPASGPLSEVAAAFVQGAALPDFYAGSNLRPFDLNWKPKFFTNPCEAKPAKAPLEAEPLPTTAREAALSSLREELGDEAQIQTEKSLAANGVDSVCISGVLTKIASKGFKPVCVFRLDMSVEQFITTLVQVSKQQATPIRAYSTVWMPTPQLTTAEAPLPAWHEISDDETCGQLPAAHGTILVRCTAAADGAFCERLLNALRLLPDAHAVFLDATGQFSGFARTLALEQPQRRVRLIRHAASFTPAHAQLAAELAVHGSFAESRYGTDGMRSVPAVASTLLDVPDQPLPLEASDVVLVTAGGKGITAACAHQLARTTSAALALIGRSPAGDDEVSKTLDKLTESGIRHRYWSVDIADAAAMASCIAEAEREFGTITAILHGAGINDFAKLDTLSGGEIETHLRAKVHGMRQLLGSVPAGPLKIVVALGSIIARCGYDGSAAYAMANDQLAGLMADYQRAYPHIFCQTQDWTAWAEIGMAKKKNVVSQLQAAGLELATTEAGTAAFLAALRHPLLARPIMAPSLPALATVPPAGPLPVIADWPTAEILAFTPGAGLAVAMEVSLQNQSWLAGHAIEDQVILPGMLALELMDRVVAALSPGQTFSVVEDLVFSRRLPLPQDAPLRVLIHATVRADGSVRCQLAEPGHPPDVSAVFLPDAGNWEPKSELRPMASLPVETGLTLAAQVYESLLFHKGEFRRISRYSHATAAGSTFHLHSPSTGAPTLQQSLLTRDAFIHGIQVSVPANLLLPARIGRLSRRSPAQHACTVVAQEISRRDDGTFVYDVSAHDGEGLLIEHWQHLELKRYKNHPAPGTLPGILAEISRERQPKPPAQPRFFEYRPEIGLKESNIVGNVYFSNHVEWQGRCRERFLKTHAPEVMRQLITGALALVTVRCECDYTEEVLPDDTVAVRMTLETLGLDRVTMRFEYWRINSDGSEKLVATGRQTIASRRRTKSGHVAIPLPESLVTALQPYLRHA